MLYLTCTTITSADLANYGVSRAKDKVSVDCGTTLFFIISDMIFLGKMLRVGERRIFACCSDPFFCAAIHRHVVGMLHDTNYTGIGVVYFAKWSIRLHVRRRGIFLKISEDLV